MRVDTSLGATAVMAVALFIDRGEWIVPGVLLLFCLLALWWLLWQDGRV